MSRLGMITFLIAWCYLPFSPAKAQDPAASMCRFDCQSGAFGNNCMAISTDGKRLVVAGGTLGIAGWSFWDIQTGKKMLSGKMFQDAFRTAISPDGKTLAIGGRGDEGSEVRLVDAESGRLKTRLMTHGSVGCVEFTRDGKHLLSLGRDNVLRVWSLPDAKPLVKNCFESRHPTRNDWEFGRDKKTFKAKIEVVHSGDIDAASQFVVTPDSKQAIVTMGTLTVFFLDVSTGKFVKEIKCKTITALAIAISRDGSLLALAGDGGKLGRQVEIWDLKNDKHITTLASDGERVHSLAISPDNRYLLTGSWKGGGRVWEIATGQMKHCVQADVVKYHDLPKGDGTTVKTALSSAINSVGFMPDGKSFVTLHAHEPARFWSVETGKEIDPTKSK